MEVASAPPLPAPQSPPSLVLSASAVADTIGAVVGAPIMVQIRRGTAPVVAADVRMTVLVAPSSTSLASLGPKGGPYAETWTTQTDAVGAAFIYVSLANVAGQGTISVEAPALGLRDSVRFTVRAGDLARITVAPHDTAVFVNAILQLRYDLRDRAGNAVTTGPVVANINGLAPTGTVGSFLAGSTVMRGRIELRAGARSDTVQVSVVPRDTMVFSWIRDYVSRPYSIVSIGLDGAIARVFTPALSVGPIYEPELSPDGRSIVANEGGGYGGLTTTQKLYMYDTSTTRRELAADQPPSIQRAEGHFTRAGDWIFFRSVGGNDSTAVWRVRPDGSGLERLLVRDLTDYIYSAYPFPDGQSLIIAKRFGQTATIHGYRFDIATRVLVDIGLLDSRPSINPRGDMIAWYQSGTTGGLFVETISGTQARKLATIGDFVPPAWTRDGQYVVADGNLVNVTTGEAIPLPWMTNTVLGWRFVEPGARP
jgi:hypothetical protein